MKTQIISLLVASAFLPVAGFSQTAPAPVAPVAPVAPAAPPAPPAPPIPARERERGPKVPVTYLGVETAEVPSVVAEQLGLATGFGLVVDYVVPDGAAAAAGVQQNDILRMLNDQILVEPDQLAKLVRSFKEGDTISLTVLRKGAETKLSAKLQKRDVHQSGRMWDRGMRPGPRFGMLDPQFKEEMKNLGEQMKTMQLDTIKETVENAREEARRARGAAQRGLEEAMTQMKRGVRVLTSRDNGAMKTTRVDLGKAQITYSDTQGEMTIERVNGKKLLTAKDPQGRLLFSGPVETKEELDKIPAEVRQRYDNLETKDLPAIAPNTTKEETEANQMHENDADEDDDNGAIETAASVTQVRCGGKTAGPFPYGVPVINTMVM